MAGPPFPRGTITPGAPWQMYHNVHHTGRILSMAVCSCVLTIMANGTETLWYRTAPINFYTLFPVAIAGESNTHTHWFQSLSSLFRLESKMT